MDRGKWHPALARLSSYDHWHSLQRRYNGRFQQIESKKRFQQVENHPVQLSSLPPPFAISSFVIIALIVRNVNYPLLILSSSRLFPITDSEGTSIRTQDTRNYLSPSDGDAVGAAVGAELNSGEEICRITTFNKGR